MKIAYSPCPNDTFIYHAWAHGLVPDAPPLDITYADINITNDLAANTNDFDIIKISYAALPWVLEKYTLLPCGGALGRGCGPLVLTKQANGDSRDPSSLIGKRVAIPSDRSTAYLLFRLWASQQVKGAIDIQIMPFEKIMPAVRDGIIDAGLVIHEARFTYQDYGLQLVADLGRWWESDTGLPIPLGAIVAKRGLDISSITQWIRSSLEYAWKNPDVSREYILQHAQEMSYDVAKAHIELYVNSFSFNLGEEGFAAVKTLLRRAVDELLIPGFNQDLLYI
ncbi:1,4-dihydroxy-6-naphthoate synthase [Desulfuribacillus stibiiarsenatis]|uniref:1,4-dihydroxy-6-naphtoate synthase n=1 Tax=Desulfuribacillus stibiiarsenatis TaxID=1390249 RepID=A0A1E5L5G8_9FIRM|nr:1,4-dihydroxy-6-naphthoate synthase [Desulfuribacillus stibiiarsenatis]